MLHSTHILQDQTAPTHKALARPPQCVAMVATNRPRTCPLRVRSSDVP